MLEQFGNQVAIFSDNIKDRDSEASINENDIMLADIGDLDDELVERINAEAESMASTKGSNTASNFGSSRASETRRHAPTVHIRHEDDMGNDEGAARLLKFGLPGKVNEFDNAFIQYK